MNTIPLQYTIEVLPPAPQCVCVVIGFPAPPTEEQKTRALEIVAPLSRVQRAGLGVRILLDGATVEEALRHLPREVNQALSALR